jgi:hypothetical protein
VEGSIDSKKIQDIKKENGNKSINLRIVYMMNCYGSLLNTAWLNIGARACSGATDINYLPEPFMYLFWTNWKKGQSFKDAVENAYKTSIEMIETIIRSAPGVGFYLSASIDVKNLAFVKSTKPIVVGQGSLTINSA